jgi:hypothetical protein
MMVSESYVSRSRLALRHGQVQLSPSTPSWRWQLSCCSVQWTPSFSAEGIGPMQNDRKIACTSSFSQGRRAGSYYTAEPTIAPTQVRRDREEPNRRKPRTPIKT